MMKKVLFALAVLCTSFWSCNTLDLNDVGYGDGDRLKASSVKEILYGTADGCWKADYQGHEFYFQFHEDGTVTLDSDFLEMAVEGKTSFSAKGKEVALDIENCDVHLQNLGSEFADTKFVVSEIPAEGEAPQLNLYGESTGNTIELQPTTQAYIDGKVASKADFTELFEKNRRKQLFMLYLKSANLEDIEKEYEFITNTPSNENGFTNFASGCSRKEFEIKILPGYINAEKGIDLADGWVPETDFFLWDDEKIVGLFRVRHYLTPALANGGGHIGYGIKKEFRGKGYASEGLRLTIEKAWHIIKEDEIYMSVHRDNMASLRVQIKNGAYIHHQDEKEFYTRIKR